MIGHRTFLELLAGRSRRLFRRRDPAADERAIVAASGLLDASYYLIHGPDVHEAGADPLDHFMSYGWREGRRPNPCFDPAWYREVYLGQAPDKNPLVHYIIEGEAEGCRPIAYFQPEWYRQAYGMGQSLVLRHYLENRRSQRFSPNPHFDLAFYLSRYGSDIGPNRDPFAHLIRCGASRDLDPSPSFNARAYRLDKMAAGSAPPNTLATHEQQVPLVHFLDAQARSAARAATRSRRS